jgi:UDP-N-acetylmuramyl pentapeptide phosphotransferase/UDP-N-acetylglucosamine-1-phosphate transferase
MLDILFLIFIPVFIYLVNSFFLKRNLLPNYSGNIHQKFFNNKSVPLSGGLFLCFFSFLIFFEMSIFFISAFLFIFLLGFLSDINILSSVKLRFLFQAIIIFFLIFNTQGNIQSIRIDFIDVYLQNFIISCLFTTFCMMILVNGTNFIDGLNGLGILYFLIIIFILFRLNSIDLFFNDLFIFISFIILLCSLLIFNFFNKLYLGDSGSYLVGILIGYFLISVNLNYVQISPYFIALILWYPAFEILFSIIRKFFLKKSPFKPDNSHFHHLLFFFINKKFDFEKNISNNFSSLIITAYNFIIFNIALLNIYFTYLHVILIIFNVIIYLVFYKKLLSFKKSKSLNFSEIST